MSTLSIAPSFELDHTERRQRAPQRHQRRSATASTVRLTRRGRLVLFLGSLAMLFGASVALGAGAVGTEEAERTRTVTVTPGDTLWEIAGGVAAATGESDIRDVVNDIEQLNHLESPALTVGQRLQVPVATEE